MNGKQITMAVLDSSLPAVLAERAATIPHETAYTFIDYEVDPAGHAESLTWSEVHQRALVVAEDLSLSGSIGDRAAILAPQGLDYIVALFGALQAGFIAVPLPVPYFGVLDERVSSALRESTPAVILTTSSAAGEVAKYATGQNARNSPFVLEVDSLDLSASVEFDATRYSHPKEAFIQYTSGSTGDPSGVVVSHRNVIANERQIVTDYFDKSAELPDATIVSWAPFYHDMGLLMGICAPLVCETKSILFSPMGFLQRPARWMQLLAKTGEAFSAAPNFALELATRRTSDQDMAGLDLGGVVAIINGAERVHAATIRRFNDRFSRFNLKDTVIRPSYGLAEATVYVATPEPGRAARTVLFDSEKLSNGQAIPCDTADGDGGVALVSHGVQRSTMVRVVDPETMIENPAGTVGEIWVHGEIVTLGYWRRPDKTESVFGARLVNPTPGTPVEPWLRTGDLGVIYDNELFITGRIKDLLILDGSNHYPDDIEATVQEMTGGRVAAIAVGREETEDLVVIVELKNRGTTDAEFEDKLRSIKREITSAITKAHRVRVADLVPVSPGSIPITTSGKIRRSACLELCRRNGFVRLDA
jgi:long-chain fatty acid adenylase/transferase FadD26